MRLSAFCLAASLWSISVSAIDASLDPWDVHSSCDPYKTEIKNALTEALGLADAARTSLETVLQRAPDKNTDPDAYLNWKRISVHVQMAFGYAISSNPTPNDRRYTEALRDIYAKAVRVLPSNTNDPEHGNNPTLAARPGAKPVIVCGDGMFQWFDADQEPEPGVGKIQDQPYFQRKAQQGVNLAGALYFQGRFSWNTRRVNSMGVCIGNRQAVISAHDDLIIICDAMLDPAGKARTSPSPSAFKASVSAGTDLREGLVSFPTQLWHELGHWFGGVTPQLEHIIQDHPAVDRNGRVLYKDANNRMTPFDRPLSKASASARGLRQQGAYGISAMMDLAMSWNKKIKDNCGPDKATTNADSLMIFSLMMYNDQWDWTNRGQARDFTRLRQKLGMNP